MIVEKNSLDRNGYPSTTATTGGRFLSRQDKNNKNKKKDKMEMWYYANVVEYSPGKTYLKTEITFINDRCRSISFFNQ